MISFPTSKAPVFGGELKTMNTAMAQPMTETPQERLAAILDSLFPRSIVSVSLNPIPVVSQWCKDHDCELIEIQEQKPVQSAGRHPARLIWRLLPISSNMTHRRVKR